MRRLPTAIIVSLFVLSLGATGCVDDGGNAIIVLQNTVPEEGCIITVNEGVFRASGAIEANAPTGYFLTPLVESRFRTENNQQVAQRTIQLNGAEISLSLNGTSTLGAETKLFSGSLRPDGGLVALGFEIISSAQLQGLTAGDVVVAEIVVFGTHQGGDVESDPFFYPVDITGVGALRVDLGDCALISSTFESADGGNACNSFQDGVTTCCSTNGFLSCPGMGTGL